MYLRLPLPVQGACIQPDRTMLVTECEPRVGGSRIWAALHFLGLCVQQHYLPAPPCTGALKAPEPSVPGPARTDCDGGNLTRNLMAGRVNWYRRGKKVGRVAGGRWRGSNEGCEPRCVPAMCHNCRLKLHRAMQPAVGLLLADRAGRGSRPDL